MTVRQEEETPIGNYFHDNGLLKIFNRITDMVDEFEVDTSELSAFCDSMIDSLKGMKAHIKKVEAAWEKRQHQAKINDFIDISVD